MFSLSVQKHAAHKRMTDRDICRRSGDLCKQQPNLAPIQSNELHFVVSKIYELRFVEKVFVSKWHA